MDGDGRGSSERGVDLHNRVRCASPRLAQVRFLLPASTHACSRVGSQWPVRHVVHGEWRTGPHLGGIQVRSGPCDPSSITHRLCSVAELLAHSPSVELATTGGTPVTLTGTNFGPAGAPVTGRYSSTSTGRTVSASSCFVSTPHTQVQCTAGEGYGAG
jgi:hypothetical protein